MNLVWKTSEPTIQLPKHQVLSLHKYQDSFKYKDMYT